MLHIEKRFSARPHSAGVLHSAAAEALVIAVEYLFERTSHGQTDLKIVVPHGGEVAGADKIRALFGVRLHAHERNRTALAVVDVQPLEAVPAVVAAIIAGVAVYILLSAR